jgi:hypothetical protein
VNPAIFSSSPAEVRAERVGQRGGRVHPQVRPRRQRGVDRRLVHVVKMLVRQEHGFGAGDDIRGVRGERARIDDERGAFLLEGDTGVLMLGQLHRDGSS